MHERQRSNLGPRRAADLGPTFLALAALVAVLIACGTPAPTSSAGSASSTTGTGLAVAPPISERRAGSSNPASTEAAPPATGAPTGVSEMAITIEDPKLGPLTFDALAAGDPGVAAQGRLVVLLHGFPETDEAYRELLPALAGAGYYAVAFNQRGYSPQARPTAVEAYNMLELVSDVRLVADQFGASTFHVVGHDWGGAVAWVTAALHPDSVLSLTALSTPHPDALSTAMADPADPQHGASAYMQTFRAPGSEDRLLEHGRQSFLNIFGPGAGGLPQVKVEAYADVLATPPALRAALNWYRASPLPSPLRVGAVRVPTLFVFGAADGAFAVSTARATASLVTGPYRYLELPGEGHWLPETAEPQIAAALLPHLAGTDPAR